MTMVFPDQASWIALSDHHGALVPDSLADTVESGVLVMELSAPQSGATVLLSHSTGPDPARTLSVFHDPETGIVVLQRLGAQLRRYVLPGPLPGGWSKARLSFMWNSPDRIWRLSLEEAEGTWTHQSIGADPLPVFGADLLALCEATPDAARNSAVEWFGVAEGIPSYLGQCWIGHRSPVDTPNGPRPAEALRPGDLVQTLHNGPRPIVAMTRATLPNRGRFSPILLRAPYFGTVADLLVSPGQLVMIAGAAVEYLFGEDTVLTSAASLSDGNVALTDHRRPVTSCIELDLGIPDLILVSGCPLLTKADPASSLPYRLLHDYEALPLKNQLVRASA